MAGRGFERRSTLPLMCALLMAASVAVAGTGDCGADGDTSSDTVLQLERLPGEDVAFLDENSSLSIVASNGRSSEGEVRVAATILCDVMTAQRETVANAWLPPRGRRVLEVTAQSLQLPRQPLRFSGVLTLTAEVHYPDGLVERASPALELHFHTQGGGWAVYGAKVARERFHSGVLQAEDRRRLPARARIGTSFARRVSENTYWRPEGDSVTTESGALDKREGVKICIEQLSAFSDAGVGEDYWQSSSSTARASRGAWAAVIRDGDYLWVDFLGDGRGMDDPGSGCTEVLEPPANPSAPADYDIQIFSYGKVQGNWVNVAYDGNPILDWNFTRSLTGTGTHVVSFDPTGDTGRAFDVYMVGAYCQYRHTGGVTDETYRYRLVQNSSNSFVYRGSDTIMIGELRADRKFIIAHETGHLLGDFGTGNNDFKTVSTKCQCYDSPSCPSDQGSHTMISKERTRCALAEGFAHFYAAAVFNWHGPGAYDCAFHYYKEVDGDSTPTVNCEQDDPDGPFDDRYMESNCAASWSGMGTELDWLRTFWDMLSADPTTLEVADFVEWFDQADYWHDYFAVNELDEAADAIGGDLDAHWDYFSALNGVDWPGTTLLFADGFESGAADCWSD